MFISLLEKYEYFELLSSQGCQLYSAFMAYVILRPLKYCVCVCLFLEVPGDCTYSYTVCATISWLQLLLPVSTVVTIEMGSRLTTSRHCLATVFFFSSLLCPAQLATISSLVPINCLNLPCSPAG